MTPAVTAATTSAASTARPAPSHGYAAFLAAYLRPRLGSVALLAALLLGGIGLQLVNPQLIRAFIDSAGRGAPVEQLVRTGALFLLIALASQALAVAGTYVGENVGWSATNALRTDLLRRCLALDLTFHNARTPGELIERIDGDVTNLSNFFSRFVILILGGTLLLAGTLAMLFREDWRVGAALTAYTLFTLAVLYRVRFLAVPSWGADRQTSAAVYGFLEERIAGLVDLHANGAQRYVLRRFFELIRRRYYAGRRAAVVGGATFHVGSLLFTCGYVVAFGLGTVLYLQGGATLGTIYLIYTYTWMLRRPLEQITRQVQDFQKAAASIARVRDVLALRSPIPDTGRTPLPPSPLSLAFDHVTFAYPQTKGADGDPIQNPKSAIQNGGSVLDDVSFAVHAGRILGVLGRTGSGKTTLSRLLFRLYDVQQGAVRVGGVDVRDALLADLQRRIGLVTQEVQLFQATIRDNLTLFDRSVPDARLRQVIDDLELGDWFRTLRGGLDEELTAGGSLSAGEAQLLALTRVFLRDPGLVILDEASSRLDPATERLVDRAVRRLLQGRTAIVIAHRLATVLRADSILILEDGRVRESGDRAVLATDPRSRFGELLRAGRVAAPELAEVLA